MGMSEILAYLQNSGANLWWHHPAEKVGRTS